MEEIVQLLRDLSVSENPLESLHHMKNSLLHIANKESMRELENQYGVQVFAPLFDLFNSSDKIQINMCIDILAAVLSSLEPVKTLRQLHVHYQRGLNHPEESIQIFVLKQLTVCAKDEDASKELLRYEDLLISVLRCLNNSNLDISSLARNMLIDLCKTESLAIDLLFFGKGWDACKCVMQENDKGKFNLYDIAAELGRSNEQYLNKMSFSGILSSLVKELSCKDPLIQLTVLETLSTLSTSEWGLRLLHNEGIVGNLTRILSDDDPFIQILIPGVLKFFGRLGAVDIHYLMEPNDRTGACPTDLIIEIACKDLNDPTSILAFETIAHISYSVEGKIALGKYNSKICRLLDTYCSSMTYISSEVKVRIFDSAAKIFYIPDANSITEDLSSQMEAWLWKHFYPSSNLEKLVLLAKTPIEELAVATLQLLNSFAHSTIGINRIINEPGLMEWLLDRGSPSTSAVKTAKWELIGTIGNSTLKGCGLTEPQRSALQHFYRDGPLYKRAENAIITEET